MFTLIYDYIVKVGNVINDLLEEIGKVVTAMANIDCKTVFAMALIALVHRTWTPRDDRCWSL